MPIIIDNSYFDQAIQNAMQTFSTSGMYELSNVIVNYYMDCFNLQGFDGIPWPKSMKDPKGATLVLTGQLRNSIVAEDVQNNMIRIVSDTPYSEIHNNGGTINVTERMRKYFWFMHSKTKDDRWKYMALSNSITIPQRKFMGASPILNDKIKDFIVQKLHGTV